MHVWYYTYAISDDTLVQVWVHSWNTLWVAFTLNPLEVVNMNDNHVLHTATTFHPLPWEWSIKVSGCHSLNARFLKPRQMSWSQWGNCSCWLVATICHCPRDQFDEQWRLLDTVGAKLSLKKMRGRRKSQWVSGWDSEWWKLWWHHCTACGSSWGPYLMWILWNTLVLWKSKPVGAVWEVHSIRTVWEGDWGVCAETSSQSSEMR